MTKCRNNHRKLCKKSKKTCDFMKKEFMMMMFANCNKE